MMLICLLLCGVGVLPVHGFLLESCQRKDPPPGVVVVNPGSRLVLSCSGRVMVDGVRVPVTRERPAPTTTHHNDVPNTREGPPPTASGGKTRHNDATVTRERRPAPTATHHTAGSVLPTLAYTPHTPVDNNTGLTALRADNTVSNEKLERQRTHGYTLSPTDEYDWRAGDTDEDHEDQEEEKGEDLRVTRAVRSRAQWRRNGRLVTGGGGRVQFGRLGSVLALAAATVTDTGTYTCAHPQGDGFSVKIHVAGPPEQPILECYKRSPSSKIRCVWTPQRPVSAHTFCSLLLYKGQDGNVSTTECSYSRTTTRWWCAVEHTEDEHRTLHRAVLCVSSLAGSNVSPMLEFTPLGILKPDPPSAVTLRQVEGQERRLVVTWGPPLSWKSQDNFYILEYELMYRPLQSTLDSVVQIGGERVYWQVEKKHGCYTITDALRGMEYTVQLRAKDDYEGHWSDWSTAVYGHTWTAQTSTMSSTDDLSITMYPFDPEFEGSGIPEAVFNGGEQSHNTEVVWYHVLLASSSCVILLVALAAYTVRRVGLVLPCSIHKPPSPPQGALSPSRYKHTLPDEEGQQERGGGGGGGGEEEDNGEEVETEETKAFHFDNSSYFLVGQ